MHPKTLAQSRQQFAIEFDRDQPTTCWVEPAGQFFGQDAKARPHLNDTVIGLQSRQTPAIRGGTVISRRKCWPSHFLV